MERDAARLVTVGPWQMFADVAATRAAYRRRRPETCRCAYCRNFDAARAQVYPATFIALLQELGIDPTREIEVYDMGRTPSGRRLDGGWFYLIGQLSRAASVKTRYEVEPNFSISITTSSAYPVADFDGPHVLQLDFVVEVPWVLAEPGPE